MANKNKHSVTTEYGTFTRTSESRVYSHLTVICGQDEATIRTRAAEALAYTKKLLVRYQQGAQVAERTGFAATLRNDDKKWVSVEREGLENPGRMCGFAMAEIQKWIAAQEQIIAEHDAKLAKSLAENTEKITNKVGGEVGWSSRIDLAVKNANKYRAHGYYTYVIEVATGKVVA